VARGLKNILLLVAGLVWIVFAFVLCLVALQLLLSPQNPDASLLSHLTPLGVGVAAAHVLGLGTAAFLSFVTGVTLCACGLVPKGANDAQGLFLS
jgi:hypothetical protein